MVLVILFVVLVVLKVVLVVLEAILVFLGVSPAVLEVTGRLEAPTQADPTVPSLTLKGAPLLGGLFSISKKTSNAPFQDT